MELLIFIIAWLSSIIFHEIGHVFMLRYINGTYPIVYYKDKSLEVGDDKDYKNLSKVEFNRVVMSGIGLGLFPIILFSPHLPYYYFIPLLFIYYRGCNHDIKIYKKC